MKKTLLTLVLALAGFGANSQVIFSVEAPASIAGGYDLNVAAITDWGVPDMSDPANAVLDTVVLANDLSPTQDSLMCIAATPGSLNGKIAMLYRGDCNFSTKAKNAQNAGAIAVIIVNNISGPPVGMAGGTEGLTVTIPVVMISQTTGALIKAKLLNDEDVVAFIGNKAGYYDVDLGTTLSSIMTAPAQAIPLTVAMSGTEFPVKIGAFVRNYGAVIQTGVTLRAEVKKNGTSIYNQLSDPIDFVTGTPDEDSIWVDFPTFAPPTYTAGKYTVTYTVIAGGTDEYPGDNVISTQFDITDNMFSLAPLDADGLPNSSGGIQPGTPNGAAFTSCIVFRNSNGSRIGARGLYFGIQKNAEDGDVVGEEVLVQGYKWNDQFVDVNDAAFDFASLEEMGAGSYTYATDLQDTLIYQEFETPFMLEDDQRYLFCFTTNSSDNTIFHAYDTEMKYDQLEASENQPLNPINNGGGDANWGIGFASKPVPSIGVKTYKASEAGLIETSSVDASVYPNPAKEAVTISIIGFKGDAHMTVTDVTGKIVMNKSVSTDELGKVKVNTAELNNGMYIFNIQMANGTTSKFNVVVNK